MLTTRFSSFALWTCSHSIGWTLSRTVIIPTLSAKPKAKRIAGSKPPKTGKSALHLAALTPGSPKQLMKLAPKPFVRFCSMHDIQNSYTHMPLLLTVWWFMYPPKCNWPNGQLLKVFVCNGMSLQTELLIWFNQIRKQLSRKSKYYAWMLFPIHFHIIVDR